MVAIAEQVAVREAGDGDAARAVAEDARRRASTAQERLSQLEEELETSRKTRDWLQKLVDFLKPDPPSHVSSGTSFSAVSWLELTASSNYPAAICTIRVATISRQEHVRHPRACSPGRSGPARPRRGALRRLATLQGSQLTLFVPGSDVSVFQDCCGKHTRYIGATTRRASREQFGAGLEDGCHLPLRLLQARRGEEGGFTVHKL